MHCDGWKKREKQRSSGAVDGQREREGCGGERRGGDGTDGCKEGGVCRDKRVLLLLRKCVCVFGCVSQRGRKAGTDDGGVVRVKWWGKARVCWRGEGEAAKKRGR